MSTKFQFCNMKKVLETSCSTKKTYLTRLNCTLTNDYNGMFDVTCILPQLKIDFFNKGVVNILNFAKRPTEMRTRKGTLALKTGRPWIRL